MKVKFLIDKTGAYVLHDVSAVTPLLTHITAGTDGKALLQAKPDRTVAVLHLNARSFTTDTDYTTVLKLLDVGRVA